MCADLKTANCFLTNDGRLKVGDFNVSKLTKNQLQANTQIGTPYYMSVSQPSPIIILEVFVPNTCLSCLFAPAGNFQRSKLR